MIGIEARLHVVGTLAAGLQRVDAHHLVLAQADRQRLLGVAALELALGDERRCEAVVLLGVLQEIRNRRQRTLRRGRLHLGDDLGDLGGKLGTGVFRRLHGDIVFRLVVLPEHPLGLARVALGLDPAPVGLELPLEVVPLRAVGLVGGELRRREPVGQVAGRPLGPRDGRDQRAGGGDHRQQRHAREGGHPRH